MYRKVLDSYCGSSLLDLGQGDRSCLVSVCPGDLWQGGALGEQENPDYCGNSELIPRGGRPQPDCREDFPRLGVTALSSPLTSAGDEVSQVQRKRGLDTREIS